MVTCYSRRGGHDTARRLEELKAPMVYIEAGYKEERRLLPSELRWSGGVEGYCSTVRWNSIKS